MFVEHRIGCFMHLQLISIGSVLSGSLVNEFDPA